MLTRHSSRVVFNLLEPGHCLRNSGYVVKVQAMWSSHLESLLKKSPFCLCIDFGDGWLAMNLFPLQEIIPLDNLHFHGEAWHQIFRRGICGSFAKSVRSAGHTAIATLYLCLENTQKLFSHPGSSVFCSPRCLSPSLYFPRRQWQNRYRNLEPQRTSQLLQQWWQ